MRAAAAVLALALVALAGASVAAPLVCSGKCVVTASTTTGYQPPLLLMASGSVVEWVSTEGGHASVGGGCLHPEVGYNTAGLVADVRFDIVNGRLWATTFDPDFGTPEACDSAALPDGSRALSYACPWHSNMKGRILVRA